MTAALDPASLASALPLAESARPTPALVDAWRQLHHAAQLASEVGKAWAVPAPDDSHSSLGWHEGALVGVPVGAGRRVQAALVAARLELVLAGAEDGATLASRPLDGATFADAGSWLRREAQRLVAAPPRQAAVPAPDLPPHPVATGAPFELGDRAAFAALAALLAAADAVLRRVREALPGASEVRTWPHHFDTATLVELPAGPGASARSIGLGLAVPDALEADGYWYVSPWSAAAPGRAARWPELPYGRWHARGGTLRLAALPLGEVAALPSAAARNEAIARFLAAAYAAAHDALA